MTSKPRLSVCIPTYNRAAKLRRTVELFARQILDSQLENTVEIFVSDNASTDNTADVMRQAAADFSQLTIRYQQNAENLGITGNMFSLFEKASGEYVWFFADDDIPFPGSLKRILQALEAHTPSMIIFSFSQPPGSTFRHHNYPEDVHLERDTQKRINLVTSFGKVSIYVLRRADLEARVNKEMEALHRVAPLYGWMRLPIEVMAAYDDLPIAIISDQLAGCDEDYLSVNWHPLDWKAEAGLFDHPFIKSKAPEMYRDRERRTYVAALEFYWKWRTGELGISSQMEPQWWEALRQFPMKWRWVLPRPSFLVKFVTLKLEPRRMPLLVERAARRRRS